MENGMNFVFYHAGRKRRMKKEINSFSELLEYREQRIYIKRANTMHITKN